MTRVSCQKIWGSIPGSPKWSDDSWRLCICKVPTPTPSPREGRANWGQSTQDFIFLTSHIQQQRLFVSKGGKNEQRAIHASLYIIYFSFSITTPSCFQGRGDRTNGNSCEPLRPLLLTLNKQRFFVSKGRENEQRAIHASLHIIYFSFSTSNASCFQGRRERTKGNPCRILYSLLHIFNNNAFLFPREGRMNRGQFMRAFTFFTSHTQ